MHGRMTFWCPRSGRACDAKSAAILVRWRDRIGAGGRSPECPLHASELSGAELCTAGARGVMDSVRRIHDYQIGQVSLPGGLGGAAGVGGLPS